MTKFIIVTDSAFTTNPIRDAITAFLEAKGWSSWHWFQDLWLVSTDAATEPTRIDSLREEIKAAIPAVKHIMVMTTEGIRQHSGLVPKDSVPWLRQYWHPSANDK